MWLAALCLCLSAAPGRAAPARPHIILIIADDLGWNDVGFHGSNQIPTPNIDALAYSGVILHNYYVNPICTPSRAALMTGKDPIHLGMQHSVLYAQERRGLPLGEPLLPAHLRALGYRTHLVGKWHLGFWRREYLPVNRGYETHMGFLSGRIDYYDHVSMEHGTWGTDLRDENGVAHDLFGKYVTDLFTDRAVNIIKSHNASSPLFLTLAHAAVHSGNAHDPLRAPERLVDSFAHIQNTRRRKFAAMLTKLDQSVGRVAAALREAGLLDDCVILFTTDNGGPAEGFNDNAASNYPLRGVKNTLWEGGVRAAGFLWSRALRPRVALQRLHVTDWLPTLLAAAGGNLSSLPEDVDGVNQWEALTLDLPSNRTEIIHNIDDIWGSASISSGKWKLHKGTNYQGSWDRWYGPDGRGGSYNVEALYRSPAGAALSQMGLMPDKDEVLRRRQQAAVSCGAAPGAACKPLEEPCLFDIDDDPCEQNNVAAVYPDVLQSMLDRLAVINQTAVPPNNTPLDPRGDARHWDRVYLNFGDFLSE